MAQAIRTDAGFRLLHRLMGSAQLAAPMADWLRAARLGTFPALRQAPGGTYQIVAAKVITSLCFLAPGFWIPPLFQSISLAIPWLDFYVSPRKWKSQRTLIQ